MAGSGGTNSGLVAIRPVSCIVIGFILVSLFFGLFISPSMGVWLCPLVLKQAAACSATLSYTADIVNDSCSGFDMCTLERIKPTPNNLGILKNSIKAKGCFLLEHKITVMSLGALKLERHLY